MSGRVKLGRIIDTTLMMTRRCLEYQNCEVLHIPGDGDILRVGPNGGGSASDQQLGMRKTLASLTPPIGCQDRWRWYINYICRRVLANEFSTRTSRGEVKCVCAYATKFHNAVFTTRFTCLKIMKVQYLFILKISSGLYKKLDRPPIFGKYMKYDLMQLQR